MRLQTVSLALSHRICRVRTGRHLALAAVLIAASLSMSQDDDLSRPDEPRVSITPRAPLVPDSSAPASRAIRLDVKVVLIPVTVTDLWDRPIMGLRKDDFHLFEDNVEQKIAYISSEDAPASVGLIFDASGSMRDKIDTSVAAVDQFFKTSLPGDEFLLVRFSDRAQLISGFTGDVREISVGVHSFEPAGSPPPKRAIFLGF